MMRAAALTICGQDRGLLIYQLLYQLRREGSPWEVSQPN
jgi:hypothetical protein